MQLDRLVRCKKRAQRSGFSDKEMCHDKIRHAGELERVFSIWISFHLVYVAGVAIPLCLYLLWTVYEARLVLDIKTYSY